MTSRLVKNEHRSLPSDGSSYRQSLKLTARQSNTRLADGHIPRSHTSIGGKTPTRRTHNLRGNNRIGTHRNKCDTFTTEEFNACLIRPGRKTSARLTKPWWRLVDRIPQRGRSGGCRVLTQAARHPPDRG